MNFALMQLIQKEQQQTEVDGELDLKSVVDVLTQYIMHNSVQTKVAVLKWIHHLYTQIPSKVCLKEKKNNKAIFCNVIIFVDGETHRHTIPCLATNPLRRS